MQCSLWLLLPEVARNQFRALIEEFAQQEGADPFEPHVTIVGGITINDDADIHQLCRDLENELRGRFGAGIDCHCQDVLASVPHQWNQALVAVLHQTQDLEALVDTCRAHFHMEDGPRFAPELNQPHLSLYYGTQNIPNPADHVRFPRQFTATRLALWSTEPAEAGQAENAGVGQWAQLGEIHLHGNR